MLNVRTSKLVSFVLLSMSISIIPLPNDFSKAQNANISAAPDEATSGICSYVDPDLQSWCEEELYVCFVAQDDLRKVIAAQISGSQSTKNFDLAVQEPMTTSSMRSYQVWSIALTKYKSKC